VRKADADAGPIMFIIVTKDDWTPLQITDYVDRVIQDRFSAIDGVSQVNIGGQARPSMRIWLDPEKLAAFRLTPSDIENALRSQNVELPAGRLESQDRNLGVRINRPFETAEQFAALVVARADNGYQVRLGDVAKVEVGAENPNNAFRMNGRPGVGMGIVRQSGANTLAVAEAAKKLMGELQPTLPKGMVMAVGSDDSVFVDRAIEKVYETLLEAAVLVVLVIFLFLGSVRATFIPAITVPICLLATCATMWILGLSLNLLTLLAFVLAIGLVVDDAIVVLENVYHRIEEGEDPLVAAFLGSRQVGFAIISTTLVVCAVFVPVMFIAGQTGLLFRELAITMIAAVGFSGFIALSLAPMLCSKLLKPASQSERGRMTIWIDARFKALERRYSRALDRAIRRPLLPLLFVIIFLGLSGVAFLTLVSELAPAEDTGVIQTNITAPEGTGFAQMNRYNKNVEQAIMPMVKEGSIRSVLGRVPGSFTGEDYSTGRAVVFLKNWEDRDETTADVATRINRLLSGQPGVRVTATPRSPLGRGGGSPLSIVISGSTYEDLVLARDRILAAAEDYPGIVNLDSDYKETTPQLSRLTMPG
jgi:multidrug efflux pump